MKCKKFDDLFNLTKKFETVMQLEKLVYVFAYKLSSKAYSGGIWESLQIELEDDKSFWYFQLKSDEVWKLNCQNIQSEETISSKCLSVLAFSFAINYLLSFAFEDKDCEELVDELTDLYYALRDNVNLILDEKEKNLFYRAID